MKLLRRLTRTAPTPLADGTCAPSPLALKLATSPKTDYDGGTYSRRHEGGRILMVCTEERHMVMANGKTFATGNHPVEMALPMLHLRSAGYRIDIATPTGAPVAIEDWAMPRKDDAVLALFRDFDAAFRSPLSLADFAETSLSDDTAYRAVFLPGGHGALLGLPENRDLGHVLRWAQGRGLFTLAICHGPAALLAARDGGDFPYTGYRIAAFPDSFDRQTPLIGYMPGHLTWYFGETLAALGVEIVNSRADGTCHVDRRLITGASPKAANRFGRLAAETLLDAER